MASRLLAVPLDAHDPERLGRFWSELLGREAVPHEGHVVLADPEGNALCVIEAGNGFLADPDGNEFSVRPG